MVQVVTSERVLECRSDACSLWTVITDTDRINRAIGMARQELTPLSGSSAARYLVHTSIAGFPVDYEERPFEWVYLDHFKIRRRMRSGPIDWIEMTWELVPSDRDGTRLTIRLFVAPRIGLLAPILRYQGAQSLSRIAREILSLDASLASGARPHPVRTGAPHAVALDRAERALAIDVGSSLARRIADHVRDADDGDVSRIRPFELADAWELPRRDVLAACLRAVSAGMLELRWEIVCPSCRTAADTLPSLSQLEEHGGCQLCDIAFDVDLDQSVEATFRPTRAVREVDVGPYCIGGPARTPHVVAQSILPARGRAALVVPREIGSYRLFVRGGAADRVEVRDGAPSRLDVDASSLGASSGEALAIAPGGAIHIHNPAADETHAKLERTTWARKAATAREVTAMPAFRKQFSSDTLRPGVALKVSRVGLFFSDLTGSTALYSSAGDAAAFRLVQDHFDVLLGILERNGGTLVKTIGDAVMAAFVDDLDGLVASVAILHAFETFRKNGELHGRTHIKLGVFGGPCYVITANGVLDYFGQTANIAARLQSEARAGELIVEATLADHAVECGRLDPQIVRERYAAMLKGVDRPVEVARISLSRTA